MSNTTIPRNSSDPYDLNRFVQAQAPDHERALVELRVGRKRSHWMWYIFPQLVGLGMSATARRYGIRSLAEARAYLVHPVLGPRLVACSEALMGVQGRSAYDILGTPDDMKLHSCMTLFAQVAPPDSMFRRVLLRYFKGHEDAKTVALLGKSTIDTSEKK